MFLNFSIASKYITIIYSICGVTFIILPFVLYVFDLRRKYWMLPLTLRIFFTNANEHPGYELNFLVSAYCVNNLCMMLAGNMREFDEMLWFFLFFFLTNFDSSFSHRFDIHAFVFVRIHSVDHLQNVLSGNWWNSVRSISTSTVCPFAEMHYFIYENTHVRFEQTAYADARKYWSTALFISFPDSWKMSRKFFCGKFLCSASFRFW